MQKRSATFRDQNPYCETRHHVTFTRGNKTTTFVVRPSLLAAAAGFCVVLSLGYFAATAYWVMRDDVVVADASTRTEVETYYQDHIDRLRAEIERLSSRQMVDRESVELQVSELVRRQQALHQRHAIVTDLMSRAERDGIRIAVTNAVPQQKPQLPTRTLARIDEDGDSAIGGETLPVDNPIQALGLRGSRAARADTAPTAVIETHDRADPDEQAALGAVEDDLADMNRDSTLVLDALAVATEAQIDAILSAARPLGVSLLNNRKSRTSLGGPFVPITGTTFSQRLARVEVALKTLKKVKSSVRRLPVMRPMRSARVSSHFGPRVDPFVKRLAMHTGMDFKAPYGSRVYTTAPGTVVHAGRKGGYGKLVEVRHANGYVTRYAHLSRLQVAEGDHVVAGDIIGNVGSTGRSTGPHLHYEIRIGDEPVDPAAFVTAGDRLAKMLGS